MSRMHHNPLSFDRVLWVRVHWLVQMTRDNSKGPQGLIESLGFLVWDFPMALIAGNDLLLHSRVSCCVSPHGILLLAYNIVAVLLNRDIQERKLLKVIIGGFTNDHQLPAVRSQGVRFPRYGRFKFLKRTELEYTRVVGCPTGIERLYDSPAWLVHDYCYKMHWGKVVLPLMVLFIHWYWCKWKI